MDVSKYLNQTATYKKYIKKTGNGTKIYEAEEVVKLRLEKTKKRIINQAGKIQITSGYYMIIKEGVSVGDLIIYDGKEYEVIDVEEIIDKKAKYIYSEGNLI